MPGEPGDPQSRRRVRGEARAGRGPGAPSAAPGAPTWDGQVGEGDAVDAGGQRGHPVGQLQLAPALRRGHGAARCPRPRAGWRLPRRIPARRGASLVAARGHTHRMAQTRAQRPARPAPLFPPPAPPAAPAGDPGARRAPAWRGGGVTPARVRDAARLGGCLQLWGTDFPCDFPHFPLPPGAFQRFLVVVFFGVLLGRSPHPCRGWFFLACS